MARSLLLGTVLVVVAVSVTTLAQRPTVNAGLGRAAIMPSLEPKQVMPALVDVPSSVNGTLQIEVVVGDDGTVRHTHVVASPDATGAFDRAGLAAVKSWKFKPAISANRPTSVLVQIDFELQPLAAPGQPRVAVRLREVPNEPLPDNHAIWDVAKPLAKPMTYPRVIRDIRPAYTAAAMREKVMGVVTIDVAINADGTVAATRVTKSLDMAYGLDRQALIAARYWLFEPATLDGAPVLSKAVLELSFNLH